MENKLEELLVPPDPNVEYECALNTKSKGFTLLMKLVLLTKEYLFLEDHIIKYILDHKEELNKQNEKGWSALMLACIFSKTKSTENTIKILIDAKVNVNLKDNVESTALMKACRNSNTYSTEKTVKMLIDAGADLNLKDNDGWTSLMSSSTYSSNGSSENTVKLLIDAGVDLNLKDNYGLTALMKACRNIRKASSEKTVQMLIDARADLNLKDDEGNTALIIVSKDHNENIIKMLMDNNAIFTIENLKKCDGLYKNIFQILSEYLINLNIKKYISRTNYLNVIKHIPYFNKVLRFKYGTISQKIIKYKFQIDSKSDNHIFNLIFNEIMENDKQILDYLNINNSHELYKLKEYVDFWAS